MPKDKSQKKEKKEVKVVEAKPSKSDIKKTGKEKTKAPIISSKEILANGSGKKSKGKAVEAAKPPPPPKESSDESSEESSEDDKPETKKANGKTPSAQVADGDSSDSDSSSEDEKPKVSQVNEAKSTTKKASSSSSSSDSEDDSSAEPAPASKPTPKAVAAPKGAVSASKAVASPGSDSDDSDSEESDSDSSDQDTAKAKPINVKVSTQKPKAPESSSEGDSDSDDSDDKEDVMMADATLPPVATGKRKAEDDVSARPKKAKVDVTAGDADSGEIKTLFVGQLSWNVDNDWLASEFAEAGEVVSARVQMDRQSGRSRGFGYVEFSTAAVAQSALVQLQGKEIDGRAVKLDLSAPRQPNPTARAKQFGDVAGEPSSTLFVGNISWNTTEDMLWEHFGQYGDVSSVRIPTDRETGKPKGFGYVEYSDIEGAKKGFEGGTGSEIDGRNIRLDYSQPRDSSGGGGGGGFGGRGRGGDRGGRGGSRGFGDRGGRGGGRGRGGDRGGRGGRGGRGAPRGGARTGGITSFEGRKKTFD